MFCPKCAAENESDKSYCRQCGQPLGEDQSLTPKLTSSAIEQKQLREGVVAPDSITEQSTLELKRGDRTQE